MILFVGTHGQSHKVLVHHSGLTFHFSISHPERVGQPLDLNTADDEVVQGQFPVLGIVLGQDVLHEGGAESVAHLLES